MYYCENLLYIVAFSEPPRVANPCVFGSLGKPLYISALWLTGFRR